MPHITISKPDLYRRLGLTPDYSEDSFRDLCFEFGVELEDVIVHEDGKDTEFHIEIPANRYDLLCLEGFARAFRFFMNKEQGALPFNLHTPADPVKMIARKSVMGVRPIVVCAVLRNITFTPAALQSFIDFQEKLHHNICRRRTLCSVGTHDLDTIEGPYSFEGRDPKSFKFITLRGNQEVDGLGMMEELQKDANIRDYLPLIRDKPHYPVIFDKQGRVLSVPPIINGAHSKISEKTKNVLIEVTALDLTKAHIVLNMICLNFSEYCEPKFQVETVQIEYEDSGKKEITPEWTQRRMEIPIEYLSRSCGVEIDHQKVVGYLHRLQLPSTLSSDNSKVLVDIPPIRPDIFHACDIAEDVAIGYGFNRILQIAKAPPTICRGNQVPINQFSDSLRVQCALAGWSEVMTFTLCSVDDNFKKLNRPDDDSAVIVANPLGPEYKTLRVSLFPGLLHVIQNSKKAALPIKIFEINDVCRIAPSVDVGAICKRCLCAFYVDQTSGFARIHGFFDRIMQVLNILPKDAFHQWLEARQKTKSKSGYFYTRYYTIVHEKDPIYFPGTCGEVRVMDTKTGKEQVAGNLGILHPKVLKEYEIGFPISAVHLSVDVLMEGM